MPTNTFFNLPPPKREKLLQAATAEFTRKPYGEVSINRIIQVAEIPRGSFYQYFSDKTDLFQHVLHGYGRRLETAISKSLDLSGGRPLDLPLILFDLVLHHIQENHDGFVQFLGILRQNLGMDAGQLLDLPDIMRQVRHRADWTGLNVEGQEEQLALLDLLLSSTGQSLMAVCCGKAAMEAVRERLSTKIALIRRGVEIKEEPATC